MKVAQDVYWSDMHPTKLQEARMKELLEACYETYCWTIDNLANGVYKITQENLYDTIDKSMKPDWIESRPQKVCPWTTMRYMIREACNNWLDEPVLAAKDPIALGGYLKQRHEGCLYIPASRMPVADDVQVERVCRVKIDHVDIPTRVHLVIAHKTHDGWKAEIRAAKKED